MPQHARVDEDDAENARHDEEFQHVVEQNVLLFGGGFPEVLQEENQDDEATVEIDVHITHVENFDQNINRNDGRNGQKSDDFFRNGLAINDGNGLVIVGQIAFDVFQILYHFTNQEQQKQESGVAKNDFVQVFIIQKNGKKGKNGQKSRR